MNKFIGFIKNNWQLAAVLCAGFLIRTVFVFQPFDVLIVNILPDDAFYYFKIAKNILAGLGSTFDGINPANGYHPLWMVLILPIFYVFSQGVILDINPIYAVLWFSVFINIASAVLLWKIFSKYTENKPVKSAILFIWLLNPYNIFESLNGLETSLSLFFIILFFWLFTKTSKNDGWKHYCVLGFVGGLMVLSRLDNILYFFACLAWIWLFVKNRPIKKIFMSGISAFAVILPWLVWNVANFRSLLTSSGTVSTIISHHLIEQDHGGGWFQKIKAVIYFSYNEVLTIIKQTGFAEIFLVLLGFFLGWLLIAKNKDKINLKSQAMFLFYGFWAIFVLNASLRWFARTWYFISFNIFLAVFYLWFWEKINDVQAKNLFDGKKAILICLAFLVPFSFYVNFSRFLSERELAQKNMYEAVLWTNKNLPEGAKIGAFNAGIQGYFSNHRLINLDGLVNISAYEAIKNRKLWSYVLNEGIEYIVDFDVYLDYRFKGFFGEKNILDKLSLVKNIALSGNGRFREGINIYRVKK